ncbi:hypothetical protein AURDEDRAFT_178805 [Auricularia subglabra TFB-10046 SS5]|uniref:Uncharacterized protein n=1 Tax=Auricularia subglabra (strain TFB-10046 / SS5) TaxID=717982 RepID=J0D0T0_AURST|nr:hypothetical protein AURDEDRAFT_178805 [Auricularia subglabra TFB-10046 SS5]
MPSAVAALVSLAFPLDRVFCPHGASTDIGTLSGAKRSPHLTTPRTPRSFLLPSRRSSGLRSREAAIRIVPRRAADSPPPLAAPSCRPEHRPRVSRLPAVSVPHHRDCAPSTVLDHLAGTERPLPWSAMAGPRDSMNWESLGPGGRSFVAIIRVPAERRLTPRVVRR